MSEFREHVAGPVLRGACLCARCGEVLHVHEQETAERRRWPLGTRVASDGHSHAYDVTGWPYTPCQEWQPQMGERPVLVPAGEC